jgi:hypothetical protein
MVVASPHAAPKTGAMKRAQGWSAAHRRLAPRFLGARQAHRWLDGLVGAPRWTMGPPWPASADEAKDGLE